MLGYPFSSLAFSRNRIGCCRGLCRRRDLGSVMVREFAFSSTGSVSFRGLATVGFAAIATFLDFTVVILGSGLNGARFGSIGVVAAALEKQLCEVHVSTTPCCGTGQLQPIKVALRAPMTSVLINSFPRGQIPFPALPGRR